MRLTTARYYTPSGRSIQAKGIDPDIVVEAAKIEKLAVGDTRHEADLKGALANPDATPTTPGDAKKPKTGPASQAKPADQGAAQTVQQSADPAAVDAAVIGSEQDYQLERASDLLRGIAMFGNRIPH
jgi:carboxyl-terminal processing protease